MAWPCPAPCHPALPCPALPCPALSLPNCDSHLVDSLHIILLSSCCLIAQSDAGDVKVYSSKAILSCLSCVAAAALIHDYD